MPRHRIWSTHCDVWPAPSFGQVYRVSILWELNFKIADLAYSYSPALTRSNILDDYLELLKDEVEEVRIAAIRNFNLIKNYIDDGMWPSWKFVCKLKQILFLDAKMHIMVPFWLKLVLETLPVKVHLVFAQEFGGILWSLKGKSTHDTR